MITSRWILTALLTPLWWASGLMLLALVADLFESCRARIFDLFYRMDRTRVARRGLDDGDERTSRRLLIMRPMSATSAVVRPAAA
jgi:hypothetical protein